MPLAHLYILEGREEMQKKHLIEAVTTAISEALDTRRESIRVLIQEIPKGHWGIGGQTAEELRR